MASASTVAVVVPSPATSLVLLAASLTSLAPMFSYLSLSSTSSATVTPSLVIVGAPQPLSMTALRPRGPRVAFTARASFVTPSRSALRASASKASILAAMYQSPFGSDSRANENGDGKRSHRGAQVAHNKGDAECGGRI